MSTYTPLFGMLCDRESRKQAAELLVSLRGINTGPFRVEMVRFLRKILPYDALSTVLEEVADRWIEHSPLVKHEPDTIVIFTGVATQGPLCFSFFSLVLASDHWTIELSPKRQDLNSPCEWKVRVTSRGTP